MGCFMSACAVTGRTIQHYDRIVAFIIANNEDGYRYEIDMSLIHPWDKVALVSMPIFGTYDDYGSIEPDDTNALAMEHLAAIFPNVKIVNDDAYSSAICHEFLHEKVIAYDSKEYSVGLIMIHRDTYDYLMSKYKRDGRERLDIVLDEFRKCDKEDFWEVNKLERALDFSADHGLVYKYGKENPEDYHAPNLLRALSIMNVEGPMHKLPRHLAYSSPTKSEIPHDIYEKFELWSQTQALMEAFDVLGIQLKPILYMGQDDNNEEIIDLTLNSLLQMCDRIGLDEAEYGISYDYKTKTQYSMIDKYQSILDDFHRKATAKLAEYKVKAVYEEDKE